MKKTALLAVMMALVCQLHAQKKIYIPEDLRKMDLQADTSQ